MHLFGRLIVAVAMSAASAMVPARAQSRGSVAGTITDGAGVPIAGAQVTLRDRGRMTISDARGFILINDDAAAPVAGSIAFSGRERIVWACGDAERGLSRRRRLDHARFGWDEHRA
jgi:hypothetical protein